MTELQTKKCTLFDTEKHIQQYQREIQAHERNAFIITIIYLVSSICGLILQTIVSFMLGSKSISNIRDTFTFTAFICNMVGTIIITIINFLKLETKINEHSKTVNDYENLIVDIEKGISIPVIIEKQKNINSEAPSLCF